MQDTSRVADKNTSSNGNNTIRVFDAGTSTTNNNNNNNNASEDLQ